MKCIGTEQNMQKNAIDFVIAWVDGNDPLWRQERANYTEGFTSDNSEVRFRDWENLQYWFRGVENYAPWVNKIHFITWGHLPPWLNTDHPKLHVVTHKDYIPKEYLPTFNSHTIELNMHRIGGLSEQFVYFNDDMFLTAPVKEETFFRQGLPRDTFALNVICYGADTAGLFNTNDMMLVNSHFDKVVQQKLYWKKWFSPANGMKSVLRTSLLMPWRWFGGFYYGHLPESYLKSTLEEVWEKEGDTLDYTCRSMFRENSNVNQWVFKYWQLAKGSFAPISWKRGKCFHIHDDIEPAVEAIQNHRYQMICLNDTNATTDWERKKADIIQAFEDILPQKSSFER